MDSKLVAVAVTYNPDLSAFRSLLVALRPQVDELVVVDNGSVEAAAVGREVAEAGANWLPLPENLGIAAAQNRGIDWARTTGATHVLLSDQDSLPEPDMVERLWECLTCCDESLGAVGPVPLDGRGDEAEALVYSFTTWGPKRRTVPGPGQVLDVPFVLASGCLIPLAVLDRVGPMNESLFIDHVDLAWCLRAIEDGYRIKVCGDAILHHSLGDEVAHIPGRKRPVHLHSAPRNYYMMRNTLFLLRASFLPRKWKLGYLLWMTKYTGYYLLASPGRLPIFLRALRDGLTGRGGPLS